jgi:hypothetical protein
MAGIDEPPDWLRNRGKVPGNVTLDEPPDWLQGRAEFGSIKPGSWENPIDEEPPDEDFPSRAGLQNWTAGPAHIAREIERRGFEVRDVDGDFRIRSKKDGQVYRLDPKHWSWSEAGKDILDIGGGALTLAGQGIGHIVGAAGGALVGGPAAPATGFVGGVAGGGAGAGAADVLRTEIGKRLYGFEPTAEERTKSAVKEGAYGTAGELLAPLAKPVVRGAGKLLKMPFKAEQGAIDWAGKTLDKIAAQRVLGKKAGYVGPGIIPKLDLAQKEVPELVTRDPVTKKVISETNRLIFSENDPRYFTTQTLTLNPTLAKELEKLYPGFWRAGRHQTAHTRNIAVENTIANVMAQLGTNRAGAIAYLNPKMAKLAPLFTRAFYRTMGPRGGVAQRLYGQLFRGLGRGLGRYIGLAGPIGLLTGHPGAGLEAAAGIRGAALLGHVLEKGMGAIGRPRLPTTRALKALGFPEHYGALQTALKREDLRRWLEERGREMREKVAGPRGK